MKTLVHSQDRKEGWASPFRVWGNQTLGMVWSIQSLGESKMLRGQSIQRLGACDTVVYSKYIFSLHPSFCTDLLKHLEFPNCLRATKVSSAVLM